MLKKLLTFRKIISKEFAVSHDDILPEVWIGSKQNDVAFDKFGKPNMLAVGQGTTSENYSDERKIADAHARLLNQIKTAARPFQQPVLNFHTPTEIHVRAALYKIFDLVRFLLSDHK